MPQHGRVNESLLRLILGLLAHAGVYIQNSLEVGQDSGNWSACLRELKSKSTRVCLSPT